MFARHCSEEQLLSYLDGESKAVQRWRTHRHLRNCWRCRTRLASLEAEVHALLRQVDAHPFPQELTRQARDRFLRAAAEVEEPPVKLPRLRAAPVPLLASLALSLSAFAWWHFVPAARPVAQVERAGRIEKPAVVNRPAPLPQPAVVHEQWASLPSTLEVHREEVRLPVVDLDAMEVRALYAIHQAKACLGGGIQVARSEDGQLRVAGIVASDERRREIAALLSALLPAGVVRLELRTVDELPSRRLPALNAATHEEPTPGAVARIPLEPQLLEGYARMFPDAASGENERRAIALSNEVLRSSETMLDHGWVLRNLASRFPESRMRQLDASAGLLVKEMVRDHAGLLAAVCADLGNQLEGPLSSLRLPSAEVKSPGGGDPWQESAAGMLAETQELYEGMHDLFSAGGKRVDNAPARAQRLQNGLKAAARHAEKLAWSGQPRL